MDFKNLLHEIIKVAINSDSDQIYLANLCNPILNLEKMESVSLKIKKLNYNDPIYIMYSKRRGFQLCSIQEEIDNSY